MFKVRSILFIIFCLCFSFQIFAEEVSKKVVILYISVGDGHRAAAEAIAQNLEKNRPDLTIEMVDLLDFMHETPTDEIRWHLMKSLYNWTLRNAPLAYDFIYFKLLNTLGQRPLERLFRFVFISDNIRRVLAKSNPDMVISTHPIASSIVTALMRETYTIGEQPTYLRKNLKIISVVTDFMVGESYHAKGMVIVPHEKLREQFIAMGRNPKTIESVDGIPLKAENYYGKEAWDEHVERYFRNELNLDTRDKVIRRPFFVFAGGGEGVYLDRLIDFLPQWAPTQPIEVVIVTGRNEMLREKLQAIVNSGKLHKNIILVKLPGYSRILDIYMTLADVFISKAGGLTTTERLARRKAQFVLSDRNGHFHPGQERANVEFLSKLKVMETIQDMEELNDVKQMLFRAGIQETHIAREFPDMNETPRRILEIIERVERGDVPHEEPRRLATDLETDEDISKIEHTALKLLVELGLNRRQIIDLSGQALKDMNLKYLDGESLTHYLEKEISRGETTGIDPMFHGKTERTLKDNVRRKASR